MAATITRIVSIIPAQDDGMLELDCVLAINVTDKIATVVTYVGDKWAPLVTEELGINEIEITPDNKLRVFVSTVEGKEWKACFIPGPNH